MTLRGLCQPRWLLSSLLIAGAALFAIGVAAERHATARHTGTATEATSPAPSTTTGHTVPAGETGGGEATHTDETSGVGTTHTEAPGSDTTGHSETSGETLFDLNLESNGLVAVAVAVSLASAALTWLRNRRGLRLAALAFAVVFVVFDVADVAHQLNESRAGLATLAVAIALVHVATALIAEQRATTPARQKPTTSAGLRVRAR